MRNLFLLVAFVMLSTNGLYAQCYPDRHSRVSTDGWESCSSTMNPNSVRLSSHWIMYDLGTSKILEASHFWNFNDPKYLDKGLRDVAIDYSLDGANWVELGVFAFPRAEGSSIYEGFDGPDFAGVAARYILITPLTNWGHPTCFGLSEMRVNINEPALPVNVLSFDGSCDNGTLQLEWGVADQIGIQQYLIEKSQDGMDWESFQVVNATDHDQYKINLPADQTANALYRLVSLDHDGLEQSHESIAITCRTTGVDVYPNPFTDFIDLNWEEDMNITEWELLDAVGRQVKRSTVNNASSQRILNTQNLPEGTYFVILKGNQKSYPFKVVKTNQ